MAVGSLFAVGVVAVFVGVNIGRSSTGVAFVAFTLARRFGLVA